VPQPAGKPEESESGRERGRTAEKPQDIPKKGWKDILKRTWSELKNDHVTIVAGGVAFFALLGLVPALAALISIYGLIADPAQVQQQFASLKALVPGQAYELLNEQMKRIAESKAAAGWGAVVGIALALWGGSKAVKSLIDGLNIMYEEDEKRNFFKLTMTALLLTIAGVLGGVIAIGLIAVVPAIFDAVGLAKSTKVLVELIRWPLLVVVFISAVSLLYRFGPSRDRPQWKWLSGGSLVATLLWIVISVLFSLYVAHFDSYNKTYGSLGAVAVLLMWLYLSAYVVLFGAEMNSEMERQTAKDTTKGPPKPMGQRGAYAADTLGEARP
jgi:membrane protein